MCQSAMKSEVGGLLSCFHRGVARAAALSSMLVAGCNHDWTSEAHAEQGHDVLAGGGGASSSTAATGGGDATADGAGASGGSGAGGRAGGSAVEPALETYSATVAECIEPANPDPAFCEREAGNGAMTVDAPDPKTTGLTTYAFVRFDVDPWLLEKSIDDVRLRMVVTTGSEAAGTHAGEVWEVSPFTRDDLSLMAPSPIGSMPIGADHGPVAQNEEVTWKLPPRVVLSGGSVFLGILPASPDGVDYWKLNGPVPPKLDVAYH